jgi:hypothetical protein
VGGFFACATSAQLADVALVRVTSSLLGPLRGDLPKGAEPLPDDTILALYPPGERQPRVVRRKDLPSSCQGDFTLGPWPAPAAPLGLDGVLRELIHPALETVARRARAFEQALARRGRSLPTERSRLAAWETRLAAEFATGEVRARLLAETGARFERSLRRYPAERLSWSRMFEGSRSWASGCVILGSTPSTRRWFLLFDLDRC